MSRPADDLPPLPRLRKRFPPSVLRAIHEWTWERLVQARPQIAEHFQDAAWPVLAQWDRGDIDEATAAAAILAIEPDARKRPRKSKIPPEHLRDVFLALQRGLTARCARGHRRTVWSDPEGIGGYSTEWWYRCWNVEHHFSSERQDYQRKVGPLRPHLRGGAPFPNGEVAALLKKGVSPRNLALFLVAERYKVSEELIRKSLLHA